MKTDTEKFWFSAYSNFMFLVAQIKLDVAARNGQWERNFI